MPISADISDLWWLKPQPTQSDPEVGAAYRAAMQMHSQNQYLKQMQAEKIQQAMQLQRDKALSDAVRARGMAEITGHVSEVARTGTWNDPQQEAKFWDIASRYPQSIERNDLDAIYKNTFMEARNRQEKARDFGETTQTKNLTAADAMEQEALRVEEQDPQKAAALRKNSELLRSTILAPSETIESYVDEAGHQQFRITRGPTPAKSEAFGPTVGFKTQMQESMQKYDEAISSLNWLTTHLNETDLGVRGVLKENWAKIAGQAGIEVNTQDLEPRQAIRTLRAALYRTLRSDANIAEPERKQIAAMLPSEGIVESLPAAIAQLNNVKRELTAKTRLGAAKLGVLPATWALSPEEIRKAYKDGQAAIAAGIKPDSPEFRAKYLSMEDAKRALTTYYPDQFPK